MHRCGVALQGVEVVQHLDARLVGDGDQRGDHIGDAGAGQGLVETGDLAAARRVEQRLRVSRTSFSVQAKADENQLDLHPQQLQKDKNGVESQVFVAVSPVIENSSWIITP